MKSSNSFSYKHSPGFVTSLHQASASLLLTTYQAGALLLLSAENSDKLKQLVVRFKRPMGVAVGEDKIAVASQQEITIFKQANHMLNEKLPYDQLFLPRASYFTGPVDMHDLHWGGKELFGVNTGLSCVSKISHEFSVDPYWKPSFISKLIPEDRCHLNGLCMWEGLPRYVTALGATDSVEGWRPHIKDGGVLIDMETDEILLKNLPMPHSPRRYGNNLYFLLSATGHLIQYNLKTKEDTVLAEFDGFVRGMTLLGEYLFIGISKIRKTSKSFRQLPIASKANRAGVISFHLPSKEITGVLFYDGKVDEIYDVQSLENSVYPMVLAKEHKRAQNAIHGPDFGFWMKPKEPTEKTHSPE